MKNLLIITDRDVEVDNDYLNAAIAFYDLRNIENIILCNGKSKDIVKAYCESNGIEFMHKQELRRAVIDWCKQEYTIYGLQVLVLYENGKSAYDTMWWCSNQEILTYPFSKTMYLAMKKISEEK